MQVIVLGTMGNTELALLKKEEKKNLLREIQYKVGSY
jgi:hypothetical protein